MKKRRDAHPKPQSAPPELAQAAKLYGQGRHREALAQVEKILARQADNAQAWNLAGAAALALGAVEDATLFWKSAIERQPNYAEAHYNLGVLHYQQQRWEEAERAFRHTLKLQPGNAQAQNNLGAVLQSCGHIDEAETLYREALTKTPGNADALNNLAVLLLDRQDNAEAEQLLRRAVSSQPRHASALANLGRSLARRQANDEAEKFYRRALETDPQHADAQWCLSLLLLGRGDYAAGWPLYEARYAAGKTHRNVIPPRLNFPQWRGEDLQGRSILIWYEQGYGDMIQFCRLARALKARGVTELGLVCQRPLIPLLETLDGIDTLYPAETTQRIPDHDFWSFPLSLPLHLKLEADRIPAELPYLFPRQDRLQAWQVRLQAGGVEAADATLRVGLAWQGNPGHRNDVNRSLPGIESLAPLWQGGKIHFVSLQIGHTGGFPANQPLLDLGSEIRDFGDSAAIISQLDLVICVDTAIAHLTGALGKPCWLLLPYLETDWRWLQSGDESPWYPGVMHLYRQTTPGDWGGPIMALAQELARLAAAPPRRTAASTQTVSGIQTADSGPTDLLRWQDEQGLDPAWAARSRMAADLIPAGARVLDLGCGAMHLEASLPWGCEYQPLDVVARDARTLVCDLNQQTPPESALRSADFVTMMGVLEYLQAPDALMKTLAAAGKPLLCSYCASDQTGGLDRPALGWVNAFSHNELIRCAESAGYALQHKLDVDGLQSLYLFHPASPMVAPQTRRVHVLSFQRSNNFGDRLGYHLLNQILPSHAIVSWGDLRPLQAPPDDCDLLILGIGNSLFGDLLNEDLLALVERIPTIGIFGTQYRQAWPAQHLHALLDRLLYWHARYEEDLLIYGRGRQNTSHLGDWLIDAFPLAKAAMDKTLVINAELAAEPALDRVIQHIQAHRQVYSTRLHPLLCALTSAEVVAYKEQREYSGSDQVSGKFRSLLIDVFGRSYAEDQQWTVERDAVARYKQQVASRISALQRQLQQQLG